MRETALPFVLLDALPDELHLFWPARGARNPERSFAIQRVNIARPVNSQGGPYCI